MFRCFDTQHVLQQIADTPLTTLVVKDLEHRFLLVDQNIADALDLPMEEMIGRHDLEIGIPERMVLVDPDSGFPGFWALDDETIKSGCPSMKPLLACKTVLNRYTRRIR